MNKKMAILVFVVSVLGIFYSFKLFFTKDEPASSPTEASQLLQQPIETQSVVTPAPVVEEQVSEKEDNYQKGLDFEKWVVRHFPTKYYTIVDWRSDKKIDGRMSESSRYPDIEIQLKLKSGITEKFAVECKWRSKLYNGSIDWASKEKIEIYNKYSKEKKQEVFLILGIGGQPDRPSSVYIVPLKNAQASVLFESDLQKYKRYNVDKDFFYHSQHNTLE